MRLIIIILFLPLFTRSQSDSLFISTDKWGSSDTDDVPVTVGTQIAFAKAGLVTHIKYNSPIQGTFIYNVWNKAGSKIFEFPFTAAIGWNRIELASPLFLPADTFVVSVYATRAYGSRVNYFTTPKVKGNLTGINSKYSSGSSYPTNNYRASCYYVDLVFNTNINITAGGDDTVTLSLDSCSLPAPWATHTLKVNGINGVTYEWEEIGDSTFVKTGKEVQVTYNYQGSHLYVVRAKDQTGKIIAQTDKIVYVVGNPKDVVIELLRDGTYRTRADAILITNPFPIER